MVSFKLDKEIEKDVFRLVTSVGQGKNSESHSESHSFVSLRRLRIFSLSHARDRTKKNLSQINPCRMERRKVLK